MIEKALFTQLVPIIVLLGVLGTAASFLSKNLSKKLAINAVRALVQLLLLGLVLSHLFDLNSPFWNLLFGPLMGLFAAFAIRSRLGEGRPAVAKLFVFLCVNAFPLAVFANWSLFPETFLLPKTFLPLLGFLLGNSLNGITLTLLGLQEKLLTAKKLWRTLFGLGAPLTPFVGETRASSLALGLTPLINNMAVMGVVSIPGLMTGQIFAGAWPLQAAISQYGVVVVIAAAIFGSSYLAVRGQINQALSELPARGPERVPQGEQSAELEFGPGKKFYLHGPSGCGKTVALERFFFSSDRDPGFFERSRLLRQALTLPQDLSPRGLLSLKQDSDAKIEMLKELGRESILDRKIKELSGGEAQILAIVLALDEETKLLMMDEGLAAVDEQTRQLILKLLSQRKDLAVLLTGHGIEGKLGGFEKIDRSTFESIVRRRRE